MPLTSEEQALLRLAIFAELEQLADARGGFLTTSELLNFEVAGEKIPLIDRARGIRNPIQLDSTLAIVSSAEGPYDDHVGIDGLLRYAFQARDPLGGDNRKLRVALNTATPIILFQKPMTGVYVPIIGVYVIDEDLASGHFVIATDESVWRAYEDHGKSPLQKKYVEQLVRRRVHQPVFRARVILAYSQTCAICRLKHVELLDAAHIIADSEAEGSAHVTNGMALCKIHHAAYDRNLLGVSADYIVHINQALLDEIDGPMLRYGLQDMHGVRLTVPAKSKDHPSKDALAVRFAAFHS
jgi:putative restriction endonuclease